RSSVSVMIVPSRQASSACRPKPDQPLFRQSQVCTNTIGDLTLQQGGEVFLVGPVLVAGLVGEVAPAPSDGRCFQHPGEIGDLGRQPVRNSCRLDLCRWAHSLLAFVGAEVKSSMPKSAS